MRTLLIALSQAVSNVTKALRTHFGFTEDALCSSSIGWQTRWTERIAAGQTIASGVTETGEAKVGQCDTVIRRWGADRVVDGTTPPRESRVGAA